MLGIESEKEFAGKANMKHIEYIGELGDTVSFTIPQDDERFNKPAEDGAKQYCWTCDEKIETVEKTLCSGCRKARYCTQECLRIDWGVHGEFCQRRREKRVEKEKREEMEMIMRMKDRARRDIEADNNVD
jgi:hypothetical protein